MSYAALHGFLQSEEVFRVTVEDWRKRVVYTSVFRRRTGDHCFSWGRLPKRSRGYFVVAQQIPESDWPKQLLDFGPAAMTRAVVGVKP